MADSGPPVRSFAQAAATAEQETHLRVVQIDGLVVMKIIKHCRESPLVTGQLLGLDIGATLEVTNCFPFPGRGGEEDEEGGDAEGANYQLEMMRCLREVNVDNNTVGWYQSTFMGSYQTEDLIVTFQNYAENIKRCVCIVYDPQRSSQGALALKATRLKDNFMALYKEGAGVITSEKLRQANLSWPDVFEEIPIQIHNSALVGAVMTELEPERPIQQCDYDRLTLSTNPFLEKNLEFLIDCMDDLAMEQQKVQFYLRAVQRQDTQRAAWIQKRRAENAIRRGAGEEPLPEEDPNNPIFKQTPEPSRLDTLLASNFISNYCSQINGFAGQSLSKLYVMDAVKNVRR